MCGCSPGGLTLTHNSLGRATDVVVEMVHGGSTDLLQMEDTKIPDLYRSRT